MDVWIVTGLIAFAALVVSVGLFASRWARMQQLAFPRDRSIPKDSASRGLVYAFTLGMAPWSKESTQVHALSYLRGIAFHVGIFAGLAVLLVSPWLAAFPFWLRALFALVTGLGAMMGAAGGIMRITERNLAGVSTADDHVSVWLVTAWLAITGVTLLAVNWLPAMWITSAVMLLWAPIGKIRHCIYFYFGRLFFGLHIGRRGIVRGLMAHAVPFASARREAGHGR